MTASPTEKSPAQVPGDAESPPEGKTDPTIKRAIRHTDRTEPVQDQPTPGGDEGR